MNIISYSNRDLIYEKHRTDSDEVNYDALKFLYKISYAPALPHHFCHEMSLLAVYRVTIELDCNTMI